MILDASDITLIFRETKDIEWNYADGIMQREVITAYIRPAITMKLNEVAALTLPMLELAPPSLRITASRRE